MPLQSSRNPTSPITFSHTGVLGTSACRLAEFIANSLNNQPCRRCPDTCRKTQYHGCFYQVVQHLGISAFKDPQHQDADKERDHITDRCDAHKNISMNTPLTEISVRE